MAIKPEQTGDWELKVTVSHWTRKDHGTHSEFMVFQGWNVSSAWLGLMTPSGQETASRALGGSDSQLGGSIQAWGWGLGGVSSTAQPLSSTAPSEG